MISNIGWCVWHRGDRPEHQFKHSLPSHPGARLDMRSYSILFFQCALCLTFPFQPWTFGFAVCRANCFLMEVRISCWCLRSYTLSYFFGGWFPPSLEGGCSGVHKHSMVAFPHIYPMICKYLFSKVVPAVYTSTLFLLLLDRTRALSAASSGHRKVSLCSHFLFQFQWFRDTGEQPGSSFCWFSFGFFTSRFALPLSLDWSDHLFISSKCSWQSFK